MNRIHSSQALGAALRAARKSLGLTQPELALAAGVGVRFVVELEAGKPTVQLAQVLRVVDALGGELRLEGLFEGRSQDSSGGVESPDGGDVGSGGTA